ncbi:MAG: secretin and TonB N-terminal domain-containing protein [Candidatus Omnitrophica bacterium]|nr:secretin and TonB N-terminal domain-containing protein [Candidatus Omnitrophota bacterium]MBI3021494.1 secretin and TonB N-terminal domain-containing protein [Candidatus Omnitrophota bacterium]
MKRRGVGFTVLWIGWGIIMGGATPGWAQQDEASTPPPSEPSLPEAPALPEPADEGEAPVELLPAETLPPAPAAPQVPTGLISIDFKDAEIRQVLRIISLKSSVDIVAGSDVEGLITIKLTNVPWEQALDIILRTYGFTYERKGNVVRVMSVASQEQEALATEVFSLDYAKAKEVPDVITEILSDRGKVKFDERTNTVVVTDIPSNLFQIKQVVQRLDQRTPQATIETKVVETKLDRNEKLGIDWSDSFTLTAGTSTIPTTFPFPAGAGFGKVGELLIPRAGVFSPSTGASLNQGRVPDVGGTFTFGTLTSSGLVSALNFLQSRTDTHIVSNPTIAVLNNHEAKVHIGEEYPIPNYTIDATTGRPTISGYTAKNIGTVLTVTPHVNPSEEIVVDLKPEVVSSAGNVEYSTGASSSISLPRFTVQSAQTQVRIKSGETIAIGGLVKKSDVRTEAKVPFLADIPLVGFLFKNVNRYAGAGSSDPARQDLIIFLTVKLMDEPPPVNGRTIAAASPEPPYR